MDLVMGCVTYCLFLLKKEVKVILPIFPSSLIQIAKLRQCFQQLIKINHKHKAKKT